MSNLQYRTAKLPGRRGPYFPSSIELLQLVLTANNRRLSREAVIAAARNVASQTAPTSFVFRNTFTEPTSDEYDWEYGLEFKAVRMAGVLAGLVFLLIPKRQDDSLKHGTVTDRSCAVYATGAVTEDELEWLARGFNIALNVQLESAAA